MTWTKRILLALLGLVVLILVGLFIFLRSKAPQYSGEVVLGGLEQKATVAFDDYGIPHIHAQNATDAYQALGYVHASERLFQMEMLRRVAKGQLSEVLGEDFIPIDELFLTMGLLDHGKKSAKIYEEEKPPSFEETMAYIKGVNAYIDQGKKPLEFHLMGMDLRPFELEDCFAIAGYMAFSFAVAMRTDPHISYIKEKYGVPYLEALNINREGSENEIPVLDGGNAEEEEVMNTIGQLTDRIPVGLFHGSNGFVISGNKTKSGKPILVNDTHIRYSQPSVWYESHIEYPGHRVYGNYLAGFPYAIIGHTDHHSWGMTMFELDDIDFYIEQYNPSNSHQIQRDSSWVDLDIKEYEIKVKGASEPRTIEVKRGSHGPIVNDVLEEVRLVTAKPVSMKWVYTDFISKNLEASFELTEAKSMQGAFDAMSKIHSPAISMVYADINNNIAWWGLSKVPIRPDSTSGKSFYRGYTSEDDYLGYLPFEDNPHDINPESGIIVNANNQPAYYAGHLHPGYYIPKDRYARITELLEAKDRWSPKEAQQVILDDRNTVYADLTKYLIPFLSEENRTHPVVEKLNQWDGNHRLEATAPVVYYRWLYHLDQLTMEDELGEKLFSSWISNHMHKRSRPKFLRMENNPWWDNIHTEEVEQKAQIINRAWELTIAELNNTFGNESNQWKWQKARSLTHGHALGQLPFIANYFNAGPFDMAGGKETVMNQLFVNDSTTVHEITGGAAIRRVIDMKHPDSSWNVLPTGQSGHPASPHYQDQAPLYHQGNYRMQWMQSEPKKDWSILLLKPSDK